MVAGAGRGGGWWWVEMRHLGMYMLMNGSSAANWVPRWGLPSLIPFILQAQGFPEASTATLLGAFFPVRAHLPRPEHQRTPADRPRCRATSR